jgi:alpha-tubulin suppressor-like RCC1 family protein
MYSQSRNLPPEILQQTALHLNLDDLAHYCQTSKYLKHIICDNENFWYQKIIHDHHIEYPERFFSNKNWKQIYMGLGNVYVAGWNRTGQLGLNDRESRNIPTLIIPRITGENFKIKQVSCSSDHTLMIDTNNNVWGVGSNYKGELGLQEKKVYVSLMKLKGFKALEVSAQSGHSVMIDLDNRVWVMGSNYRGQLGLGVSLLRHTLFSPMMVLNVNAIKVSTGSAHTVIIDTQYNVWVTGTNTKGQLGLNIDAADIFVQIPDLKAIDISAGAETTLILDENNNVWGCGANDFGQLGLGSNIHQVDQFTLLNLPKCDSISCNHNHTVAIDQNGHAWVMGLNYGGQLGLNHTHNVTVPTIIDGTYRYVSTGMGHTALIDNNNDIWTMGSNAEGELALGLSKKLSGTKIPTKISWSSGWLYDVKAYSVSCGLTHTAIVSLECFSNGPFSTKKLRNLIAHEDYGILGSESKSDKANKKFYESIGRSFDKSNDEDQRQFRFVSNQLKDNDLLHRKILRYEDGALSDLYYIVPKQASMSMQEFKRKLLELGRRFHQDYVIIVSNRQVEILYTSYQKLGRSYFGTSEYPHTDVPNDNCFVVSSDCGQEIIINDYLIDRTQLSEISKEVEDLVRQWSSY